ncbi:hypothetical protein NQ314_007179 [Rhamnusium bicolor]|uniref:DNA polymerase delta subunit 3 n=1 Tax=Rhamnusium bicolor TaxID=1586634 RepID=A0AAV8YRJ1_9CUCU|nr:hypothetical protein NQ314_007179 [Rhamnusium bicolor]
MDSATEEIYFQKLQEFIQDDDKIVTVSSFASDLGISLQNSRKLINKYVEDQRKLKPDELAVTYVLTGILKDKRKGVFIVKEDNFEEKQGLFENVPHTVVYSVQKCKHVDFNVIALVDMFNSTKVRERALDGSIGKSSFFLPKSRKSEEESKSVEKPSELPTTENKTSGGIASLFKAAAAKSNRKDSEKTLTSVKSNKPTGKQNGGLVGFLTNGSLNSSKAVSNSEIKKGNAEIKTEKSSNNFGNEDSITVNDDDITHIMDVDSPDEEHIGHEKHEVKKKPMEKKKQDKKKTNKRQRDKSEETPVKRRKRIVERIDSDSDDLFEKEEDIIDKSDDEPERVPSPILERQLAPKNKRRKAVTKNYEDEEGFIVTQTEYVYETASEDENVEPKSEKQEKKEEKPKPKVAEKKKVAKKSGYFDELF